MDAGADTPGASKENVEPPLTGRKRFSPGFSPLGKRSQRRPAGQAPVDAPPAGRRPAQRSLCFGGLDAEQSKPEEPEEPPGAEPAATSSQLAACHLDCALAAGPMDEGLAGEAQPACAPSAPAGWSAQDMPEDGAPVCAAVHGAPNASEALDGRPVLEELEGVIIASPEPAAKKGRSRVDLLADDTSRIAIHNKSPGRPASRGGSPHGSPLRI